MARPIQQVTSSGQPGPSVLSFAEWRDRSGVAFHGGALAANSTPVQLIFWGSWWAAGGGAQRQVLEDKVKTLLAGPYTSGLAQYGIAPPVWRGSTIVADPAPAAVYSFDDIADMVWAQIDDGVYPEPDDDGGRIAYLVMMPMGTTYNDPDAAGAHSDRSQYEFPFDSDVAWIGFADYSADVDYMTATFSHELVELLTDPEIDGWFSDVLATDVNEIGDICQPNGWQTAYVDGVKVMAYWSNAHNTCIIPAASFSVTVSGDVQETLEVLLAEGDERDLLPEDSPMRQRDPDICTLTGPYHWSRSRVSEKATVNAGTTGYTAATFAWTVDGKPLPSPGTLIRVRCTVTRDFHTGTEESDETVPLRWEVSQGVLTLYNEHTDGSFDVDVACTVTDDAAASMSGVRATGSERTAATVAHFVGQNFHWDDSWQEDMTACLSGSLKRYVDAHTYIDVGRNPWQRRGVIPTGDDIQIISMLPSTVTIPERHLLKSVLSLAEQIEVTDPGLAADARQLAMRSVGMTLDATTQELATTLRSRLQAGRNGGSET